VVHVSIANAAPDSPFSYYRGKAEAERILAGSGMSHAILRPAVLFGGERPAEDVLLNNIAWMLRRFPVFTVPGNGSSLIQPIHVDDLAGLAVEAGGQTGNTVRDAAGPETYTFEELVKLIARAVGSRARILRVPPWMMLLGARVLGRLVNDVVLTRDELAGLMANLLASEEPPAGYTRISEWLSSHASLVGVEYASELDRHYRRDGTP
jgi:NADH dehydrogenase